jgi:putative proteasome-type protease
MRSVVPHLALVLESVVTYCLGILLRGGLVMASDSRSNAGIDQVALARKLAIFEVPGQSVIAVLSAGNLATTQAVVTALRESAGSGFTGRDIHAARTMFDVASMVGAMLREVIGRDGSFVQPFGDPNGNFLVGGQLAGEPTRLFHIYSAGNFVEASDRSRFLQLGETKYGKPILDRALNDATTQDEAAKLSLLSFDATMRSNLSVDAPIDLLRYATDSFSARNFATFEKDDPYWMELRARYAEGLSRLVASLPSPPARC